MNFYLCYIYSLIHCLELARIVMDSNGVIQARYGVIQAQYGVIQARYGIIQTRHGVIHTSKCLWSYTSASVVCVSMTIHLNNDLIALLALPIFGKLFLPI
ncbi:hypothetical protein NPIL_84251 [Nephila pilipes]|uniref:Uncharacterized protein n=1 Tax=Nephila pilipes TaxID=299642 RepID=A0A8X6NFQ7_NEPPI|nr:hypothetical protein NPIL_84251 [Nephila pilipes]